jgi:tRNA(Ile2) C34 agmatinyltransferase TiaS
MRIKRFTKRCNTTCPKCGGDLSLTPLPQFEGRPRLYCRKCEEEIIDFPWTPQTDYPQDTGFPTPSNLEGYR